MKYSIYEMLAVFALAGITSGGFAYFTGYEDGRNVGVNSRLQEQDVEILKAEARTASNEAITIMVIGLRAEVQRQKEEIEEILGSIELLEIWAAEKDKQEDKQ